MGIGEAQQADQLFGWAAFLFLLDRPTVVAVAFGAAVQRRAAVAMARQAGLHRRYQDVLRFGARTRRRMAGVALYGSMGTMRELPTLQPGICVGEPSGDGSDLHH